MINCSHTHHSVANPSTAPQQRPNAPLIEQLATLAPHKTTDITVSAVASKSTAQNQSLRSLSTGATRIDINFIYVDANCKSC